MSKNKSQLWQIASSLKRFIFVLDLQDIYKYGVSLNKDQSSSSSITFKPYDDLQALAMIDQINPMSDAERKFALNRLKSGDNAIIGFHEGSPVFYGWVMFEEIEITFGVFQPVASGAAFAYNLYTKPSFRRQGALKAFYNFLVIFLAKQDYHSLYCGISPDNMASIKAHQKNHFAKSGYFYTLKLLGTCLTLANHKEYKKRFSINWGG